MHILSFIICLFLSFSASAVSIIRDAQIEDIINKLSAPLVKSAEIKIPVNILIVDDKTINAFATPGGYIMIHSGLIDKCDDYTMLLGVIAHELGHIKANHFVTQNKFAYENQLVAITGVIAGLITSLYDMELGAGVSSAAINYSAKNFASFSQNQEHQADNIAIKILTNNNIPLDGLKKIFTIIQNHSVVESSSNSYNSTHPITTSRINHIRNNISKSAIKDSTNNSQYELALNKLRAYLNYRYKGERKNDNVNYLFYQLIKNLNKGKIIEAEQFAKILDNSIPNNPYFKEILGEIYFKRQDHTRFITNYEQALKLNESYLIKIDYVTNLLSLYDNNRQTKFLNMAIKTLKHNLQTDHPDIFYIYQYLANSYGKLEKRGLYFYYTSLAFKELKNFDKAKYNAEKALKLKKQLDSHQLRHMQDLLL